MKAEIREDECLHIVAESPTERLALQALFPPGQCWERSMQRIVIVINGPPDMSKDKIIGE